MILVDTSVWIDFFNGHESVEAAHLRICIADVRPLTIPGLVLTEILVGVRSEAVADRVAGVLSAFDPTPELDSTDYRKAAELRLPPSRTDHPLHHRLLDRTALSAAQL